MAAGVRGVAGVPSGHGGKVAFPCRWINPTVGKAPLRTASGGLQPNKEQALWAGLKPVPEKEKKKNWPAGEKEKGQQAKK